MDVPIEIRQELQELDEEIYFKTHLMMDALGALGPAEVDMAEALMLKGSIREAGQRIVFLQSLYPQLAMPFMSGWIIDCLFSVDARG